MFELSVAFRFLREGRLQTVLIAVAISVGIGVQIFLSALIGGLQKDLINRTVGSAPHITASAPDVLPVSILADSVPTMTRVVSSAGRDKPIIAWQPIVRQCAATGWFTTVCPVVEKPAFMYKGDKSQSVLVRGFPLEQGDSIYKIKSRIIRGSAGLNSSGILIGSELARDLRLEPGKTVRIATASGGGDVFTVQGVFDLESQPVNQTWVVMRLARAQALLDVDGVTGIELQVPRVFEAETIARALEGSYPYVKWTSWQESNANLLSALKSQSGSSNLIQVLVLIAVTLGISSVLAVSAIQKSRQIGILKAMGCTRAVIGRVFLIMGGVLGFVGSILGCFAGYWLISAFLSATAKANGRPLFPLSIEPSLFLVSVAIATAAGTLAAFLPARNSARLNPIDVIRGG